MSGDLRVWMKTVRAWAAGVARRRRRLDMVDDIEGQAIEILIASGRTGQDPDEELETQVARELELGDNFSTARDSDLTAAVNEKSERESVGSFVGELVSDGSSEDTMISLLDGDPREEGRDLEEIQEDLEQVMPLLRPREEQLFMLRNMLGLTWRQVGQHLRITPEYAWLLYQKAQKRTSALLAVRQLLDRAKEPDFTQLEIEWLTL
jgi:DNA-directed RNA polymerase specialized sigma24 family protein